MFTYNGSKAVLHMQNTCVKLDEPGMYKYGLGTLETERSNVMIGHGLVDLDHVSLR